MDSKYLHCPECDMTVRHIIASPQELLDKIEALVESMKPPYEELVEMDGREDAGYVLKQFNQILSIIHSEGKFICQNCGHTTDPGGEEP